MSLEEQKIEFERRKIELEEVKYQESKALDERNFKADVSAKRWSQISTFIPILVLILGYNFNSSIERLKQQQAMDAVAHNARISFIEKQLTEFYYPIQMRLEKDNAIWQLWNKNQSSQENKKLAIDIESKTLIPNHEEILSIIKSNFALLTNQDEQTDVPKLISVINHYQKHVAIYKALRETGDYRNPIQVCQGCEYPNDFPRIVSERIKQLEQQRKQLISKSMVAK